MDKCIIENVEIVTIAVYYVAQKYISQRLRTGDQYIKRFSNTYYKLAEPFELGKHLVFILGFIDCFWQRFFREKSHKYIFWVEVTYDSEYSDVIFRNLNFFQKFQKLMEQFGSLLTFHGTNVLKQ